MTRVQQFTFGHNDLPMTPQEDANMTSEINVVFPRQVRNSDMSYLLLEELYWHKEMLEGHEGKEQSVLLGAISAKWSLVFNWQERQGGERSEGRRRGSLGADGEMGGVGRRPVCSQGLSCESHCIFDIMSRLLSLLSQVQERRDTWEAKRVGKREVKMGWRGVREMMGGLRGKVYLEPRH